jgi:hypothetical protein
MKSSAEIYKGSIMSSKTETLDMDKESQTYLILAGTFGVLLALLTTPPKKIQDAVLASVAGFCGALFVGPAVAEVITNIGKYIEWSWLDASPETNVFAWLSTGCCRHPRFSYMDAWVYESRRSWLYCSRL